MSTLITHQLYNDTPVSQKIRLYNSIRLKGLRVHIYKYGTLVDGTFKCSIYKGSTLLCSSTIDYTQINTITDTYSHGYVLFEFDNFISIEGDYEEIELKFEMTNYTDSSSYNIDLVRDYEDLLDVTEYKRVPLYNETEDGLTTAYSNSMPIGLEMYLG